MTSWDVATFAGGSIPFYLSARRLQRNAKHMPGLDRFTIYGPRQLTQLDPSLAKVVRTNHRQRGYGFWLWKPTIVQHAFEVARARGHRLVYLDAGCEIRHSPQAQARLSTYAELTDELGPVAMRLPKSNLAEWCKRETLDYFDISLEQARNTRMMEAGVMLLNSTASSELLLHEWVLSSKYRDGHLFNDDPGPNPEYPDFIDHRHDSAVLCCLFTKLALPGLPSETHFEGRWLSEGTKYPFWALRNKLPFSVGPGNPGDSIRRTWLRLRGISFPPWETSDD